MPIDRSRYPLFEKIRSLIAAVQLNTTRFSLNAAIQLNGFGSFETQNRYLPEDSD